MKRWRRCASPLRWPRCALTWNPCQPHTQLLTCVSIATQWTPIAHHHANTEIILLIF